MRERSRNSGLLMAMLAMGGMGMGNSTGSATPFTPPEPTEPTEEQKRQIAIGAKQIGQLHRFIIKGKEVFARNKKDALRKYELISQP